MAGAHERGVELMRTLEAGAPSSLSRTAVMEALIAGVAPRRRSAPLRGGSEHPICTR